MRVSERERGGVSAERRARWECLSAAHDSPQTYFPSPKVASPRYRADALRVSPSLEPELSSASGRTYGGWQVQGTTLLVPPDETATQRRQERFAKEFEVFVLGKNNFAEASRYGRAVRLW